MCEYFLCRFFMRSFSSVNCFLFLLYIHTQVVNDIRLANGNELVGERKTVQEGMWEYKIIYINYFNMVKFTDKLKFKQRQISFKIDLFFNFVILQAIKIFVFISFVLLILLRVTDINFSLYTDIFSFDLFLHVPKKKKKKIFSTAKNQKIWSIIQIILTKSNHASHLVYLYVTIHEI